MNKQATIKFERGTTQKAREKTESWVKQNLPEYYNFITTGLPEYDDRLDLWRVSLNAKNAKLNLVGEIRLDRNVKQVTDSTNIKLIIDRVKKHKNAKSKNQKISDKSKLIYPAPLANKKLFWETV